VRIPLTCVQFGHSEPNKENFTQNNQPASTTVGNGGVSPPEEVSLVQTHQRPTRKEKTVTHELFKKIRFNISFFKSKQSTACPLCAAMFAASLCCSIRSIVVLQYLQHRHAAEFAASVLRSLQRRRAAVLTASSCCSICSIVVLQHLHRCRAAEFAAEFAALVLRSSTVVALQRLQRRSTAALVASPCCSICSVNMLRSLQHRHAAEFAALVLQSLQRRRAAAFTASSCCSHNVGSCIAHHAAFFFKPRHWQMHCAWRSIFFQAAVLSLRVTVVRQHFLGAASAAVLQIVL